MQQHRAEVCFIRTATSRGHEISALDLGCDQWLPIDEGNDRPQQQINEQNKSCRHCRIGQLAGPRQNSDGGRTPDGGGRIEPTHARAFAEDEPGAEKADP